MPVTPVQLRRAVKRSMALRTPDKPQHGAYHVDPPSMIARLSMILRLAPKSARILCVGDDDLTSVCLHLLGYSRLTVVDFDRELLDVIANATAGKVRTLEHDLRGVYRGALPRLGASHDLFVTDPPYGSDGLRVFSGVGLAALAKGKPGVIVCPSRRAPGSSVKDPDTLNRALQRYLVDSGAVVCEMVPDAQRSYHGTVSSLLVVRRARRSRVTFEGLDGPGHFY